MIETSKSEFYSCSLSQVIRLCYVDRLISGYHRFPATLLLDIDPRDTVVNIVKSKLLEHLDHDVPYALQPKLEHWEVCVTFCRQRSF